MPNLYNHHVLPYYFIPPLHVVISSTVMNVKIATNERIIALHFACLYFVPFLCVVYIWQYNKVLELELKVSSSLWRSGSHSDYNTAVFKMSPNFSYFWSGNAKTQSP